MSPTPQAAQAVPLSVVPHSEQNFPDAEAPHLGHVVRALSAAEVMNKPIRMLENPEMPGDRMLES
jgi:hypothetical protein